MVENDFDKFSEDFGAAWDFHGRELSPRAMAKAFSQLAIYPLPLVLAAIDAHCVDKTRGQYPPKPADLVYQIERRGPQIPNVDEAWAMCPKSEDDSVVWTEEMAEAHAVASPLLVQGDPVGARMAFKGAYERITEAAKLAGKPTRWVVSIGWDPAKREAVLNEAVRLGRLTAPEVTKYLPDKGPPFDQTLGLLEQRALERADRAPQVPDEAADDPAPLPGLSQEFRAIAALRTFRKRLDADAKEAAARAIAERERQRLEFEAKRAEILKQVETRLGDELPQLQSA